MTMGADGGRVELGTTASGISLAAKGDALWVRTTSEETTGPGGTTRSGRGSRKTAAGGGGNRRRMALEGSAEDRAEHRGRSAAGRR